VRACVKNVRVYRKLHEWPWRQAKKKLTQLYNWYASRNRFIHNCSERLLYLFP